MADIIKLGAKRKQRARVEKAKLAENNRQKFGRTKAQQNLEKAKHAQAENLLDGHKLSD